MKTISLFILLFSVVGNSLSFAKVIQIIHTNDLHSYFQGTRGGIGGYAQLKTVIDQLKMVAAEKGIPTIYLDGGDFGEGSSYFFSNQGIDSFRALDLLGVDVAVLGNHDFMLGGRELRDQIINSGLKAKIISANVKNKALLGLKKIMPNYADFDFEGTKVRVFGLTTNEIHYMYPLRPLGFISNPIKAAARQTKRAKKDGVDFTIALTHIGLKKDTELVQKSSLIDLVVGGHSHTKLPTPQFTKNRDGREVPILQAGAHSGHIGALMIDIQSEGQSKVLDYRFIDITKDMPKDQELEEFSLAAEKDREAYFGRSWEEVIGFTEITLNGNFNGKPRNPKTCWSRHMARLTKEIGEAELGMQADMFQGEEIPAGPITFGDMIDNFPHFRNWGDQGWKISRAEISGLVFKKLLRLLENAKEPLYVTFDGLTVLDSTSGEAVVYDSLVHKSQEVYINGEKISSWRRYSIAMPSEITYVIRKTIGPLSGLIFKDVTTVDDSDYWPVLENYIKQNSPLTCLEN